MRAFARFIWITAALLASTQIGFGLALYRGSGNGYFVMYRRVDWAGKYFLARIEPFGLPAASLVLIICGVVLVGGLLPWFVEARQWSVRKTRTLSFACHNCGYSLRGLPEIAMRCPECGAKIERSFSDRPMPLGLARRSILRLAMVCGALPIMGFLSKILVFDVLR
jgi:hypothetical protein